MNALTGHNGGSSLLEPLKYPLVFFGLALLVVESAFAGGVVANSDSETLVVFLGSWMGALFLVSILVVAFLVYKVPEHIMLETQRRLRSDAGDLEELQRRVGEAVTVLRHLSIGPLQDAEQVEKALGDVQRILSLRDGQA